jgi:hypothetical protein
MDELQSHIDILDEQKGLLQKEYDKLRLFDIPNTMAEQDIRSISGEFGNKGRCTLQSDLSVSVHEKMSLHQWLTDTGNGALIVPTVNHQTLKAFCKEQIINGVELPADILVVKAFSRAVLYVK